MCDKPSKEYCIKCNHFVFDGNFTGKKIDKDTLEVEGCFIRYNLETNKFEIGCLNTYRPEMEYLLKL